MLLSDHLFRGERVDVIVADGRVFAGEYLSSDHQLNKAFVRLVPSRNTCWVPVERVVRASHS